MAVSGAVTAAEKGFTLHHGDRLSVPLLISVPHAGRDYPPELLENLRLPAASLVRLEDRYADLLTRDAVQAGIPTIVAHRARAWIDLNRAEQDIDVEMVKGMAPIAQHSPGTKQRGGLGLIPRRLSGEGEIWRRPLERAEVENRISAFHRPYHRQIATILAAMRARFGIAILLDVHSMPPLGPAHGNPPPQFVIGDRFGRSASSRFAELLMAQIRLNGFGVALNHPYSGDHILRTHAHQSGNIHALQLEIDRSLYLDASLREPGPGIASVKHLVASLAVMLAEAANGGDTLIAAE